MPKSLCIRLDAATRQKLDELAERYRSSRGYVVRIAIEELYYQAVQRTPSQPVTLRLAREEDAS